MWVNITVKMRFVMRIFSVVKVMKKMWVKMYVCSVCCDSANNEGEHSGL